MLTRLDPVQPNHSASPLSFIILVQAPGTRDFEGRMMDWKHLAHVKGSADDHLLVRNEYLVTENRILRAQIQGRLRWSDPERISLAEIGKRLGRRAPEEIATIVSPDTFLRRRRRLIARKFDGSKNRGSPHCSQEKEQ